MRRAPALVHPPGREAAEEGPLVVRALEPGVVRREVDDARRVAVAVRQAQVERVEHGLVGGPVDHGPSTLQRPGLAAPVGPAAHLVGERCRDPCPGSSGLPRARNVVPRGGTLDLRAP